MVAERGGPRRQVDRREEAESKFIQAAIRLITTKGFDGFTLSDVAEEAGYSRGLPRHYFGNKAGLLSEVAKYVVDVYGKDAIERQAATEPGWPRLVATIRRYASGMRQPANQALGILVTHALVEPLLRKTVAKLNARGFQALEYEIAAGIAAGNIKKTVAAATHARMIYAFLRGQMTFAALDPAYDARAVSESFIAALRSTIAA